MLETLGLDVSSECLYRTMLGRPTDGVEELAAHLGITEAEVRAGLDRLAGLALVQQSAHDEGRFCTVRPEVAMDLLLTRQQAEIASRQERLEASRAAAAQLIAECSIFGRSEPTSESERLIGVEAIRQRLTELGEEATSTVMTFAPGGAHSVADLEASRGPNEALLQRGIQLRTMYLDSICNHQPTLDHVAWLKSRGGRVRTAPTLPIRMIIIDHRLVVLPVDIDDTRAGAVVLKETGVVSALCALFESEWEKGLPLGDSPSADSNGLTPQEADTLRMLANGLTDEAIANRLGVSPRTARRITATLMDRLSARSRFQAGVHAVQRAWLPHAS